MFFFYFSIHQKWLLICCRSSKHISHRSSKQVISRSTVEKKERKKVSLLFFAKLVARSQGKKNSLTSHLLRILKIEKQKNGFSDSQSKIEKSLNCFLFFSKYVSSKTIFPLNNEWKARSHGLVVKADDSWSKGLEFEPRHHILDGCKRC